jgi:hypothetical protein
MTNDRLQMTNESMQAGIATRGAVDTERENSSHRSHWSHSLLRRERVQTPTHRYADTPTRRLAVSPSRPFALSPP